MLQKLINIGFTSKEAKVYLSLLCLGQSKVGDIASKANLNRITTYDILKKLVTKNIVSKIKKNKVFHFECIDPKTLFRNYKKNIDIFEQSLGEFQQMMKVSHKPKVQFFEGIEGIKRVYQDTLTSSSEILNFSNSVSIRKYWKNYDQEYIQQRIKNKIPLRGITQDDSLAKSMKKHNTSCLRKFRYVSQKKFQFTNEINIYDNKVSICSFDDNLFGIIITSKTVSNTHRDIFEMAWSFAK